MSTVADLFLLLTLSFAAILPAFGWIALGMAARRLVPGSLGFFKKGERAVFYAGMPVVLCLSAARLDFTSLQASRPLLAGIVAFCLVAAGAYAYGGWRGFSLGHRGVVSQGAYRGNLAIIGLALCASAFGPDGLVAAAMPIAVWTLLFNVIAVILLNHTHGGRSSPLQALRGMATNPLIVGIAAGAALSVFGVSLPEPVHHFGERFAEVVIPFALVCLGGAISLQAARESRPELVTASFWRLVISPVVAVLACLLFGVRGTELGVTLLLLGGPAAAACHVMVAAVGGNARLAANIVMVTTLLAPVTLSVGLFLLRVVGLV